MNITTLLDGLLDDDTNPPPPQRPHLNLPEPPQNGWNINPTSKEHSSTTSSNATAAASNSFLFSPNTDPNTIFFSGTPTSTNGNTNNATDTAARIINNAVNAVGGIGSLPSSPVRQALHLPEQQYDEDWDENVNIGGVVGLTSNLHIYDGEEENGENGSDYYEVHQVQWREMPELLRQIHVVLQKHDGEIKAAKLGSKLAAYDVNILRRIKAMCGGLIPLLEMYPNVFYLLHAPPNIIVFTKEKWERKPISNLPKPSYNKHKMTKSQFSKQICSECHVILSKHNEPMELVTLCNALQQPLGNVFRRVKSLFGGMKNLLLTSHSVIGNRSLQVITKDGKTFVTLGNSEDELGRSSGGSGGSGGSGSSGGSDGVLHHSPSSTCCLHLSSIPPHLNDSVKLAQTFTVVRSNQGIENQTQQLQPINVKILTKKGSTTSAKYAFVTYATPEITEKVYDTMKKNIFWNDKMSFALAKKVKQVKNKKNQKNKKSKKDKKNTKTTHMTPKHRSKAKESKHVEDDDAKSTTTTTTTTTITTKKQKRILKTTIKEDTAINNRNIVPSRHLWIGRCISTSKNHLDKVFSYFGEIETISYDQRENFAFVDFVDKASAMRAYIAMQGKVVGARKIALAFGRQDIVHT